MRKQNAIRLTVLAALLAAGSAAADDAPAEENQTAAAEAAQPEFCSEGGRMLSISYGYVTTDYEDINTDAEGWRISGTFEVKQPNIPILHGVTIGYMETSAQRTGAQTIDYEVKSVPVYLSPKLILGKKAVRVFAKGALGFHISDYSRSGTVDSFSSDEFGFYGGGSLGAMLVLKDKFFLNAEYEWVYMSNSYFQDGAAESAMVGIGMQL